jgi:hypothetical protein
MEILTFTATVIPLDSLLAIFPLVFTIWFIFKINRIVQTLDSINIKLKVDADGEYKRGPWHADGKPPKIKDDGEEVGI